MGGGTAAAAPPPFRPGNPALCGSCPLVTLYYCRLGDLLCYNCMLYLSYHFVCMHVHFVFSLFSGLFSFVDFPSVLWYCCLGLSTCKNRLPYNLYCVGGDIKHCTIQYLVNLYDWHRHKMAVGCCASWKPSHNGINLQWNYPVVNTDCHYTRHRPCEVNAVYHSVPPRNQTKTPQLRTMCDTAVTSVLANLATACVVWQPYRRPWQRLLW